MPKESPFISIVIPCYNAQDFLAECLNSCIEQTEKNIEIICVDDCSSDGTSLIIKEFHEKDNRIKGFKCNTNMGPGGARNKGLQEATGEYVWFVDSDDIIEKNACEILYNTASKYKNDILCFHAESFVNQDTESAYLRPWIKYFTDWAMNENINPQRDGDKLSGKIETVVWFFISKREFVQKFSFREHCVHEDLDFVPILLASSQSLRIINFTAYRHRLRKNSIFHTSMSLRKILNHAEAILILDKFITENNLSNKNFLYEITEKVTLYTYNYIKEHFSSAELKDIEIYLKLVEIYNKRFKSKVIRKKLKHAIKNCLPYGIVSLIKKTI